MRIKLHRGVGSSNSSYISRFLPHGKHFYSLIVRACKSGVLCKKAFIIQHILAEHKREVGTDGNSFPSELGTKTSGPWSITLLADKNGIFFRIAFCQISIFIIPCIISVTRIDPCPSYIVVFSPRFTDFHLQTGIRQSIFIQSVK